MPQLRVAITGASGLIGSELQASLEREGAEVLRLVRRKPTCRREAQWDGESEIDVTALKGLDAVVHLAGVNIAAHRWTPEYKQLIINSRVQGTQLISSALASLEEPPRVLISASAMGFYGSRPIDEELDESEPSGDGFLAEVCMAWEAAALQAREAGIRVVHPRFGAVLSLNGGLLKTMLPPFKLGFGGKLGSGEQAISWIALKDAVRIITLLISQPSIVGPVNVAAPQCVTNAVFSSAVAKAVGRSAHMTVPAMVVKAMYGEMGEELLLSGANITPRKVMDAGFEFTYPDLESALSAEFSSV